MIVIIWFIVAGVSYWWSTHLINKAKNNKVVEQKDFIILAVLFLLLGLPTFLTLSVIAGIVFYWKYTQAKKQNYSFEEPQEVQEEFFDEEKSEILEIEDTQQNLQETVEENSIEAKPKLKSKKSFKKKEKEFIDDSVEVSKWHLVINQETLGEFTLQQIKEQVQLNKLSIEQLQQALLWKEGMQNWIKAQDIEELEDFFKESQTSVPPPLGGTPPPLN